MESGYKILWTDHALNELAETYEYLETHFTEREMKTLATEIDKMLKLISRNPNLFPKSGPYKIRKAVIRKFNTLYYRANNACIEILSFFPNRKNPSRRRLPPA